MNLKGKILKFLKNYDFREAVWDEEDLTCISMYNGEEMSVREYVKHSNTRTDWEEIESYLFENGIPRFTVSR